MNPHSPSLYFRLDAADRFIEIGGDWDDFARDNGADESVMADRVLGTSIFSHIHGDVSGMYVRTVLDSVRLLGREVVRAYRCDSPRCKRFMEMRVAPEAAGGLLVKHRLLRLEDLPAPLNFVVASAAGKRLLPVQRVRCSMCNRLKLGDDWHEPEFALREQPPPEGKPIRVIYGVCPRCLDELRSVRAA